MSDSNAYEEETEDQGRPDPVRAQLKKVEARNKELEANRVKAEAAIRRLAFVDAGIDTSTLTAQDFVEAYKGELTPDAIREAATARKLIEPKADPTLEAEAQAAQRIGAARTAGESTSVVPDLQAEIDAANSPAELDKIVARVNAGKSV